MLKRLIGAALCVSALACSSPTPSPSPPLPPAPIVTPPPASAFSGVLTATNGGQPLAGVSLSTGSTTDAAGRFSLPPGAAGVTFSGSAILTRVINLQAPGHAFNVDAIALTSNTGFDLTFYRALVRNGYEAPSRLEPLRRWTQAPNFYIRTIDDAGVTIDDATLNTTVSALGEGLTLWTNGRFSATTIIRGTDNRIGQSGWLTITWSAVSIPTECGHANVGVSGGSIQLDRYTPRCQCPGGQTAALVRPATVKHELGHALGFWHTGNQVDLMGGLGDPRCNIDPDERERYHAAIAYARAVGNVDPDTDPFGIGVLDVRPGTIIVD